jgi:outer membrane lipoprotein
VSNERPSITLVPGPVQTRESVMNILSLLFAGTVLLLQGCSYAISPDVTRTADRTITFPKLQADPFSSKGKTVILGGLIARTKNVKTGTLIEVGQKELDYWGRPRRTDRTGGHFIVYQPRYLDALIYSPGREITVAGEVPGTEEASLDGSGASYVLINAREIKLWPRDQQARDNPTWLDPLYDPSRPQDKFGY